MDPRNDHCCFSLIALCCFMKFCKGSDVNVKMNGNSFAQGGIDGGSFR